MKTGTLQRGDLVSSVPVGEDTRERKEMQVSSEDVAWLKVYRRTCTRFSHEYQQLEEEQLVESGAGGLIVGVLLSAAAGTALIGALATEPDRPEWLPMLIGGSVGMGLGFPMMMGDYSDTTVGREMVPASSKEIEQTTECRDDTGQHKASVPWRLALGSEERSGRTDKSGALALRPVVIDILSEMLADEASLRSIVSGSEVAFKVQLADAGWVSHKMSTREIPDAFFAPLVEQYEQTLTGVDRARWENCRIISRSSREAFQCLWSQ